MVTLMIFLYYFYFPSSPHLKASNAPKQTPTTHTLPRLSTSGRQPLFPAASTQRICLGTTCSSNRDTLCCRRGKRLVTFDQRTFVNTATSRKSVHSIHRSSIDVMTSDAAGLKILVSHQLDCSRVK